ncbi:class I SAM-dependent methyltransferase [Amycolatopsis sp. NPDC004079]|uniref:class I SAM-dependent methyltransferase n=1 Tax=Amycolatopsis sp. NPDC004079 TaxID=3154549 RepID=UPI0033A10B27
MSVTELAVEARRRGAMQKEREFSQLLELLAARPPKVLLEIGAGAGGAFWAFAKVAAEDALLVSLDKANEQFDYQVSEEAVVTALRDCARERQRVEVVRADSHDPGTVGAVAGILGGEACVDFLFIDADHSEAGVEQDFRDYAKFVRPGGLIGFHDILPPPEWLGWCKVDQFWQRIRPEYRTEEILDLRKGLRRYGGIGLIHWEG